MQPGGYRTKSQLTNQLSQALPSLDVNDSPSQLGAPVITFEHVSKVYPAQPNRPALHDESMQIYAGEYLF